MLRKRYKVIDVFLFKMAEKGKFKCEICGFSAKANCRLEVHFLSKKHIRNTQPTLQNECKRFNCKTCNKNYKYASGLSTHSKICRQINQVPLVAVVEAVHVTSPIPVVALPHTIVIDNAVVLGELMKISKRLDKLQTGSNNTTVNQNINTTNNFNINLFLNETCKDAINLDSFIKNLVFELADKKLMIGSYIDGTCSIIQKNLDVIPINKRPLHYLEGEDPNQQLMHIREDNEWKLETELNWMKQVHADDDDDVVDKNQIYYALKTIDNNKLKYLGYNFYNDAEFKVQHSRLHREINRPDLKTEVYKKLTDMIKLDTTNL
jgi:hypothetical protein